MNNLKKKKENKKYNERREEVIWRIEFLGDFYTILQNAKEKAACAEGASAEVHRILCLPGTWNLSQYSLRQDTYAEILPPV